jgi:hypothetical protein
MAENQMLGGSSFPFPLQMFFKSVLHFIYLFIARQIDRFPVDFFLTKKKARLIYAGKIYVPPGS